MISVHFQGQPFSITVIQVCIPTTNAEEAEIEWFYHGIWSHHFMGNRWGNSENSVRLYFWGAPIVDLQCCASFCYTAK